MKEGLKYFTDTHLTALGLILFFVFFITMVVWVFRKDSKQIYSKRAQLPLQPDREVL